MLIRRGLFTSVTLALLLLAPQLLAAVVVPDSAKFVISLPDPVVYCGRYHNLTATVASLGKQGFAVGWENAWEEFHSGCYEASPVSGARLVGAGNRLRIAQRFEPTTSVDVEDGSAWDLSFANLGGGRFVSVASVSEYWEEFGWTVGVWYRRFAAGQTAPDAESVRLGNIWLTHWEVAPRIASGGDGLFVLAWSRARHDEQSQVWTWQKMAQVFGADGGPVSPEIAVTEPMASSSCCDDPLVGPEVGMAADGTFVVLWTDLRFPLNPLQGRRFDRAGNPLGEIFGIGTQGSNSGRPAMAMAPSGGFVVAWPSSVSSSETILVSRFTVDGERVGHPVALLASGGDPAVALDRSGRVAVSWIDVQGTALAVFNASLKRLGPVVYDPSSMPADPYREGENPRSSVAFGDDGRILTVWVGHWGTWVRDSVIARFWRAR